MTNQILSPMNDRLSLKETTGWFAAGNTFRKALTLLSDGAFKLFAHMCLEADRRTGRFQATHKELAAALGKSKKAIGTYVAELESKGICLLKPGKNQFASTIFEIAESFWPYHRAGCDSAMPAQESYIKSIREVFLSLGCVNRNFGAADEAAARKLYQSSIPLALIEDAILVGACRKYSSWFQGQALEPIQSLSYFSSLIAEIQEKPFPQCYSEYLHKKVEQLAETWNKSKEPGNGTPERGYPDMASKKIVQ
jgi:hypothetical protein